MKIGNHTATTIPPNKIKGSYFLIRNTLQWSHHYLVDYPAKELLQIHFHHPTFFLVNMPLGRFDRLLRTAYGPKPVAVRRKLRPP